LPALADQLSFEEKVLSDKGMLDERGSLGIGNLTIEPSVDGRSDTAKKRTEKLSPISANSGGKSLGYSNPTALRAFESQFESMLKISLGKS
jgi:hypothetical protein